MVCGDQPRLHLCPATGVHLDARTGTRGIGDHHIVRHMRRDALQHAQRLGHGFAGFQNVAQDCGDTEPAPCFLPSAISQRDAEPRIIDAIGQAPKEFDHTHHAPPGPGAVQQ